MSKPGTRTNSQADVVLRGCKRLHRTQSVGDFHAAAGEQQEREWGIGQVVKTIAFVVRKEITDAQGAEVFDERTYLKPGNETDPSNVHEFVFRAQARGNFDEEVMVVALVLFT